MREQPHTCCFTGHRPEKLPWGDNESDPRCAALKQKIYDAIETAYREGIRHYICGMARGCDFYFAEAVIALRRVHGDVTLEAAIPYPGQSNSWQDKDQNRWHSILAQCDTETIIEEHYTKLCMLRRNWYMVDHSALVIAVYDGAGGGTRRTLEYALRKKVPFLDISPE